MKKSKETELSKIIEEISIALKSLLTALTKNIKV